MTRRASCWSAPPDRTRVPASSPNTSAIAQATEAAWEGGWFHTGDVVRRDADENLYFVDRWKNVIRRSGENIAAAEVESVLRQHRLVREVACAAVPDDLRGEEVLACIVPREPVADKARDAADIVAHALGELAYFKAPGYVAFVDALPLTATNKIQRGELRTWARDDCRHTRLHRHAPPEAPNCASMMDYGDVVVCAPVTVPYVRRSEKSAAWWLGTALRKLLEVSGLAKQQVDGLCLSSFTLAPDGPAPFVQYVGLSPRFLEFLPTGGACGIMALRRAARAVQCGDAEVVACIAGDTNGRDTFHDLVAQFSSFSRDCVWPYGAGGPNESFALLTDHAMRRTGATREDFGKLCVAQRAMGTAQSSGPAAQRADVAGIPRRPRRSRSPLHLFDCVMPCAGADGFLVMRRATAASLGLPCVRILATIERHNAFPDDPIQWRGGWAMDADALWQQAAIGPDAIDVVQTYDDYPVISMLQFEDLGFCAKDAGADFIRRNDFGPGGNLPHNTGGGQLSGGQAGAAGGFLGLVEAVRQLTGQAEGRKCRTRAMRWSAVSA